jgi:hypothetical protein
MDKFPEAFKRMEQRIDISKCRSLQEIIEAFETFQGRNATYMQRKAIAQVVEDRGLVKMPFRIEWIQHKWGRQRVYRNLKTGRFCRP